MGEQEEAVAAFRKALELNPDNALAHNNLSVAYFAQGRFDLAIEYADRALALGYPVHSDFLTA
jgi:tetratricopeptide (TPR) repeat protein